MIKKIILPSVFFSFIFGLIISNIWFQIFAGVCFLLWVKTEFCTKLLSIHQRNLESETIRLGKNEIPISECKLELPTFELFTGVRQLLTWRDSNNGIISQIELITNGAGRTLAYPRNVLRPK